MIGGEAMCSNAQARKRTGSRSPAAAARKIRAASVLLSVLRCSTTPKITRTSPRAKRFGNAPRCSYRYSPSLGNVTGAVC